MDQGVYWSIAAVAAAACLWGSYRAFRGGRMGWAIAALMLASVALKLYPATEALHPFDERYHALVAKNLLAHPLTPTLYDRPALPYDFRNWEANHIWLHKPPLSLWMLAGSLALFGTAELALRLPGLLFSTVAIGLTYLLGRDLFSRRVGYVAAYFHAIHGALILWAVGHAPSDHVDTLFIFLVELGVFVAVREARRGTWRLTLLLGAVLGLALLTKWLPAGVIAAVWLVIRPWRSWRETALRAAAVAATAGLIAGPWQVYTHLAFPGEAAWEGVYNVRHLVEPLELHAEPIWFHFRNTWGFFGYLVFLPVLAFTWQALVRVRSRGNLAVLLWVALPYAFFTWAATKMPGYVFIAAPGIFLMEGWFFWRVFAGRRAGLAAGRPAPRRRIALVPAAAFAEMPGPAHAPLELRSYRAGLPEAPAGRGERAAPGLSFGRRLLLAALLTVPLFFFFRQRKEFVLSAPMAAWAGELRGLPARLGDDPGIVLFNLRHPIEAMYYTSYTAYSVLPSPADAARLREEGRGVVLCTDGSTPMPEDLLRTPGVRVLEVGKGL